MRLQPFDPAQAGLVSSWAPTPAEVRAWCSRDVAPVPEEVVAAWGRAEDVAAYVVVLDDPTPVGYGELWLDEEEDEIELARLLVDPARRGTGVGRTLTRLLAERGRETHPRIGTTCLRVLPDNVIGQRAYLAAGFRFVPPDTEAEWNAAQPRAYRWMVLP